MKAISLFSSGGIGDLAFENLGIRVLVANELIPERASLYQRNFPHSNMIAGDVWELRDELMEATRKELGDDPLDFVFATPPCQGMSKNGQGKLLQGIRNGSKPRVDVRNKLIIPTMDVIAKLKPTTVFFENVPEMFRTIIDDENGNYVNVIDYVKKRLGPDYVGRAEIVEFANYGIPQRRQRLITIFSKDPVLKRHFAIHGTYLPPQTHGKNDNGLKRWTSVRDVIANLPKLDASKGRNFCKEIPFHEVPVLDEKKYFWISNTPPEKGAFDNQCINPKCGYDGNLVHGATRGEDGINKANGNTPLYCEKCGDLLPRPWSVSKTGKRKIMKGYTSAYKRMAWDLPAPTLTTNLSYPSSDHKIHPEQNRVLSLHEAFKLHTIDAFDYKWEHPDGTPAKKTLICEIIGESIPPKGIEHILRHLLAVASGEVRDPEGQRSLNLIR